MINGDVMDFLTRMDVNEWDVLYKGYGYLFQCNYHVDRRTYQINIQRNKAHTNDHIHLVDEFDENQRLLDYSYVDLPEFKTYQEAIQDFVQERIFDGNTKTFWEVQDEMEWL